VFPGAILAAIVMSGFWEVSNRTIQRWPASLTSRHRARLRLVVNSSLTLSKSVVGSRYMRAPAVESWLMI